MFATLLDLESWCQELADPGCSSTLYGAKMRADRARAFGGEPRDIIAALREAEDPDAPELPPQGGDGDLAAALRFPSRQARFNHRAAVVVGIALIVAAVLVPFLAA
jgi:hypothetical protein